MLVVLFREIGHLIQVSTKYKAEETTEDTIYSPPEVIFIYNDY